MPPPLTDSNPSDMGLAYTEALANRSQGQSFRAQPANGENLRLGELCKVYLATNPPGAVADHIGLIGHARYPTKIARAIVEWIIVPMRHFMCGRWFGSVECRANQDMHQVTVAPNGRIGTNGEIGRRAAGCRFKDHSPVTHSSSVFVDDYAVHRAHASKTRCFIAGMPGDWPPFFWLLEVCHR